MELMEAGTRVLEVLETAGYEAFFVGGMVRDQLLGRKLADIDVATSAHPEAVRSLFEKTVPTGIAHGTVTVLVGKVPVEVTTYRIDGEYKDARRPETVFFTASLEEDLRRRDFTMNAMAMDKNGRLLDPLNGAADVRAGMVRAVGNARQRFMEDPLRMLRALRFVSKLGFFLDSGCRQALQDVGHLGLGVAKERIMKELDGLMQGQNRVRALELFKETGLMGQFPSFKPLERFDANSFAVLDNSLDFFLLAALFEDDAKTYAESWPFAKSAKKRIKFICSIWETPPPIAWVEYKEGLETAAALYRLQVFFGRAEGEFVPSALPISGRHQLAIGMPDILAATGMKPGPESGRLLEIAERAVVLGDLPNDKRQILAYIGEKYVSAQKNK